MTVKEIRVLTLHAGENKETTLYRLEKGWILRFDLGPSLQASTVRIFCNHPVPGERFVRTKYDELHWQSPTSMKSDRHDVYAEVRMAMAGNFSYYFTIDKSAEKSSSNGMGYFLVDPTLYIGPDDNETEITLDCLQCHTVLSKNMGPLGQWEDRLRVSKETGYNMIHFTPIQELGVSNSAYSLKNQNRLNPIFQEKGKSVDFTDVERLVKKMKSDWEVLSLTDLVYNHTAINSDWLWKHPECAYNLENSPHLRPAYVVDRVLYHFNAEVAQGKWAASGIPVSITEESHLTVIQKVLQHDIFPKHSLEEFYTVDVEKTLTEFAKGIEENRYIQSVKGDLEIIQDPGYKRKGSTVNLDIALKLFNKDRPGARGRQERISQCCEALKNKLTELNQAKKEEMDGHIRRAVENFMANVRYRFLAHDGPQIKAVTKESPLMYFYFVQAENHVGSIAKEETMMNKEGQFVMATNGWVMGDNPLRNFAEPGSNIYLRRELINWGDSVKLRYGNSPQDCPYLWSHMSKYTETTARIFHGVRLDNCHSTPLNVAEYMMDVARQVRPDLYVIGELFTGSEHLDNMFINKLGINSLIREAMSAWDAHEEGRLVFRYGGSPVGAFRQPEVQPLTPSTAHAMFFDQTHDNKCPIEVRSVYDIFPTAALVSMAFCASGSNRGYDELVPHHIHVVDEKRVYTAWSEHQQDEGHVTRNSGIMAGKRAINKLHYRLARQGFRQVFVDQIDGNIVSVTRHNPETHESVIMVSRTAFQSPCNPQDTGYIRPLSVSGKIEEVLLEGKLVSKGCDEYKRSKTHVNGLPEYSLSIRENIPTESSEMVQIAGNEDPNNCHVHLKYFPPGSVVVLRVSLPGPARSAILEYRKYLKQFGFLVRTYSGRTLTENKSSDFRGIVSRLSLSDLNRALYRCDAEERDDGKGFGAYDIPGSGAMVYCGLQGVTSMLAHIRPHNDLGHPLCNNLRDGDWLPGYIVARLKAHPGTRELADWFEGLFGHLREIPRYLIPSYFDAAVAGAYMILRDHALSLMSDFINDGSTFIHALAMGSVQFCGVVKSCQLPELSPHLSDAPPGETDEDTKIKHSLTVAAGFPHFATGYMRCWGRDTFISLRGLLLLTGRFGEARALILGFAACVRHGLIPNLLGEGVGARFNCRDAIWWWLQCIQDYTRLVTNGHSILKDQVTRLFPTDDSVPKSTGGQQVQTDVQSTDTDIVEQPLHDVIQEALQRHATGVSFRERNAGIAIDSLMTDQGFNNEVGVRWDSGFVFGGNEFNCGTWMDKMGGSEKAGNKGKPATPRDGSAVELVGLCQSSLRWLHEMNKLGHYPYSGVERLSDGSKTKVSFIEWSELICENFEKGFWINTTPDVEKEQAPELINRRAIYKDVYKGSQFWADTQLRPNFCVTMVVAPELFNPEHAWLALNTAQEVLLGPLGMKTLDPQDWAYAGDYINSDDSSDPKVANGFNYHQGPEWIWPLGYFLRAKLLFAKLLNDSRPGLLEKTVAFVKTTLTRHYEEIMKSSWQSLPELTNSNGKLCPDGCPAQAWSVATILEVLYDVEQLEASKAF